MRTLHRLDLLLRRLGAEGPLPGASSIMPSTARQPATSTRARSSSSIASFARSCSPRAPSTASGPRPVKTTTSSSTRDPIARANWSRFNLLRQQETMPVGQKNLSLADFIAPRASSGPTDQHRRVRHHDRHRLRRSRATVRAPRHDDFSALLVKALADRLAEAFAAVSARDRSQEWGIDDARSPEDVLAERHRGSVPQFGYPACPDLSENVQAVRTARCVAHRHVVTEHAAILPASSVAGLYLAQSARAVSFTVGRSAKTRWRTTRAAKGSRSTAWSVGSRRILPTNGPASESQSVAAQYCKRPSHFCTGRRFLDGLARTTLTNFENQHISSQCSISVIRVSERNTTRRVWAFYLRD